MTQEQISFYKRTGLKGNQLKSLMQKDMIDKWLSAPFNGIGYIEAATGWGKGFMIETIHHRINNSGIYDKTITTVVPKLALQSDIDKMIRLNNYESTALTYVINSFTMSQSEKIRKNCGLFIVDELHHACGSESVYFSTALDIMQYERALGFTATLENAHRDFLKQRGWNRVESITIADLRQLDLVPDFNQYNIGVELTDLELEEYLVATRDYTPTMSWLASIAGRSAFNLGMACSTNDGKRKIITIENVMMSYNHHEWVNFVCRQTGLSVQEVKRKCSIWRNAMNKRDSILSKSINKQKLVKRICKELLEEKILIFAPNDMCMADAIGEMVEGLVYHSKIKNRNGNEKKNIKGVIERFNDGENNILVSIKAVDEGVNIKELTCCINISYSSKSLQLTQRFGRALRLNENDLNKVATMINLYTIINVESIDSQDQTKLEKSQSNSVGVEWVTLEEMLCRMKNKSIV